MDSEKWKNILIEWVNCLKLCEPINDLDELKNGEFYLNLRNITKKSSSLDDILTFIFTLFEKHYPNYHFVNKSEISLTDLSDNEIRAITSLLMHYTCLYDRRDLFTSPLCHQLAPQTQLMIKNYLEKFDQTVNNSTLDDIIAQCLENTPDKSPADHWLSVISSYSSSSPLHDFLKTPVSKLGRLQEKDKIIANLKSQLEIERYDKIDLQEEMRKQSEKNKKMQDQMNEKIVEISRLKDEICALEKHNSNDCNDLVLKETHKCLKLEIESLELYNKQIENEQDELRKENEELKQKNAVVNKQSELWQEKYLDLESNYDQISEQVRQQDVELENLKQHCTELSALLDEYKMQQQNTSAEFDENNCCENLAHSVVELELVNCQKLNDELIKQIENHSKIISKYETENSDYSEKLLITEGKLGETMNQLRKTTIDADDLRLKLKENDDLLRNLNDKCIKYEDNIVTLKYNCQTQENSAIELYLKFEQLEKNYIELMHDKERLFQENRDLKTEIEVITKNMDIEFTECEDARNLLQKNVDQLKNQLSSIKTQLAHSENNADKLQITLKKTKNLLNSRESDYQMMAERLNESETKCNQFEIELKQIHVKFNEIQNGLKEKNEINQNLSSTIDGYLDELRDCKNENSELKLQLKHKQESSMVMVEKIENLKQQILNENQKFNELEQDVKIQIQSLENEHQKEINEFMDKINEFSTKLLDATNAQFNDNSMKLHNFNLKLETLENRCLSFKNSYNFQFELTKNQELIINECEMKLNEINSENRLLTEKLLLNDDLIGKMHLEKVEFQKEIDHLLLKQKQLELQHFISEERQRIIENQLEEEILIQKKLNRDLSDVNEEKENLQTNLELLVQTNDELLGKMEELQRKSAENLQTSQKEFTDKLNEKDQYCDQLQKSINEFQQSNELIFQKQMDINDKLISLEVYDHFPDVVGSKLSDLENKLSNLGNLFAKIVTNQNNHINQQKNELVQYKTTSIENNTVIVNYEEQIQNYQTEIQKIESMNGNIETLCSSLKIENNVLKDEKLHIDTNLKTIEKKLLESENEIKNRTTNLIQLRQVLKEFELKNSDLEEKIGFLEKENNVLMMENSKRNEQISKLRLDIQDMSCRTSEMDDKIKLLENECLQIKKEKSNVEEKLILTENRCSMLKHSLNEYKSNYEDISNILKECKANYQQESIEISEKTSNKLNENEVEINTLTEELKLSQNKIKEYENMEQIGINECENLRCKIKNFDNISTQQNLKLIEIRKELENLKNIKKSITKELNEFKLVLLQLFNQVQLVIEKISMEQKNGGIKLDEIEENYQQLLKDKEMNENTIKEIMDKNKQLLYDNEELQITLRTSEDTIHDYEITISGLKTVVDNNLKTMNDLRDENSLKDLEMETLSNKLMEIKKNRQELIVLQAKILKETEENIFKAQKNAKTIENELQKKIEDLEADKIREKDLRNVLDNDLQKERGNIAEILKKLQEMVSDENENLNNFDEIYRKIRIIQSNEKNIRKKLSEKEKQYEKHQKENDELLKKFTELNNKENIDTNRMQTKEEELRKKNMILKQKLIFIEDKKLNLEKKMKILREENKKLNENTNDAAYKKLLNEHIEMKDGYEKMLKASDLQYFQLKQEFDKFIQENKQQDAHIKMQQDLKKIRDAYSEVMDINSKLESEMITFRKIIQEKDRELSDLSLIKEAYEKLLEENNKLLIEIDTIKVKRKKDYDEFKRIMKTNETKKLQEKQAEYELKLEIVKKKMLETFREELATVKKIKSDQSDSDNLVKIVETLRTELDEAQNRIRLLEMERENQPKSQAMVEMSCSRMSVAPTIRDARKVATMPRTTIVAEETTTKRRISINSLGPNLQMEDEDDMFNDKYLMDLKEGRCILNEHNGRESITSRMSQLMWRNSLLPPHLKSSYPAESQFFSPSKFKEEDIKILPIDFDNSSCKLLPGDKTRKKDFGTTSYKKPGPPTPSKNGGRLSLQGNEVHPIKDFNDGKTPKRSTPSRIRALFTGKGNSIKESAEPQLTTPRRRLNIFRKAK